MIKSRRHALGQHFLTNEDELLRTAAGPRIRHKRVDLIDCDAAHRSIILYL